MYLLKLVGISILDKRAKNWLETDLSEAGVIFHVSHLVVLSSASLAIFLPYKLQYEFLFFVVFSKDIFYPRLDRIIRHNAPAYKVAVWNGTDIFHDRYFDTKMCIGQGEQHFHAAIVSFQCTT
jgi:hypothetical protein